MTSPSIPNHSRVVLSLPVLLLGWLVLAGLVLALGAGCSNPPPPIPPPPPPPDEAPTHRVPIVRPAPVPEVPSCADASVPELEGDEDELVGLPDAGVPEVPDAAPPDAEMPPDAAPPDAEMPPDATPEPEGPCYFAVDVHDQVSEDGAFLLGHWPNTEIRASGAVISREPPPDSIQPGFADSWGVAPCATAGVDYWHYGTIPNNPGWYAAQCRETWVRVDLPAGAHDVVLAVSVADGAALEVSADGGAWERGTIGEAPNTPGMVPVPAQDYVRLRALPWTGDAPHDRWKLRGLRYTTPEPVDGECPGLSGWAPARPACAAQGCDEP
jgi:hypothetical protein